MLGDEALESLLSAHGLLVAKILHGAGEIGNRIVHIAGAK